MRGNTRQDCRLKLRASIQYDALQKTVCVSRHSFSSRCLLAAQKIDQHLRPVDKLRVRRVAEGLSESVHKGCVLWPVELQSKLPNVLARL